MTHEEYVRDLHKYQDKVALFQKRVNRYTYLAQRLNQRELELLLARLMDLTEATSNDQVRFDLMFKMIIISALLDGRIMRKKARWWEDQAHWDDLIDFNLNYPVELSEDLINVWGPAVTKGQKLIELH